ncbi:hypothetical protein UPYG_G00334040 [Umbra pygmaea]|uniref:Endothelin-1 n=1 Tax=Umbra pygmaea TaxID=75934 RepID=A0ABD0WE53_UMBPY
MDLLILLSMFTVLYFAIIQRVSSVPMGEETAAAATAVPVRHIRNKRCSCASFMDRECVYFCHLDIIWVNTPERVVTYGLGNASRKKRALSDPRCKCVGEDDRTCTHFCQKEDNLRHTAASALDTMLLHPAEGDDCTDGRQCKHKLAAKTNRIKRVKHGEHKPEAPSALQATGKVRRLLEKWMVRQRHRAREER